MPHKKLISTLSFGTSKTNSTDTWRERNNVPLNGRAPRSFELLTTSNEAIQYDRIRMFGFDATQTIESVRAKTPLKWCCSGGLSYYEIENIYLFQSVGRSFVRSVCLFIDRLVLVRYGLTHILMPLSHFRHNWIDFHFSLFYCCCCWSFCLCLYIHFHTLCR